MMDRARDAVRSVGADRETAGETAEQADSNALSTSTRAQEQRLIEALRTGPKSTVDLRSLGIYQPPARVWTLRHRRGFEIATIRFDGEDRDGYRHAGLARYVLLSEGAQ